MRQALALVVAAAACCASPASAGTLSGDVGVISDYRYRGLSLSEGEPALQATLDMDLGKGIFLEAFASTIRDGGKTTVELDGSLGEEIQLRRDVSLDLSVTYYAYPSSPAENYVEANASLSATHGGLTGMLGESSTPAQPAMRDSSGGLNGNAYLFGGAELAVPRSSLKLIGSIGYERRAFDEKPGSGKWDWKLGAEAKIKGLATSLTYVDSNAGGGGLVGALRLIF